MKTTNKTKTLMTMTNLRNAEMSYPTWTLFDGFIVEANNLTSYNKLLKK